MADEQVKVKLSDLEIAELTKDEVRRLAVMAAEQGDTESAKRFANLIGEQPPAPPTKSWWQKSVTRRDLGVGVVTVVATGGLTYAGYRIYRSRKQSGRPLRSVGGR